MKAYTVGIYDNNDKFVLSIGAELTHDAAQVIARDLNIYFYMFEEPHVARPIEREY